MIVHSVADLRQAFRKAQHAMKLRALPHLAKTRVIAILLTALSVAPGRLDVTVRLRTNPHLRPGRRYDQGFDALQGSRIVNPHAIRARIPEPFSGPVASDARSLIADMDKTGVFRRLFGINDGLARSKVEGQWATCVFETDQLPLAGHLGPAERWLARCAHDRQRSSGSH